jgi:hypothetical protein
VAFDVEGLYQIRIGCQANFRAAKLLSVYVIGRFGGSFDPAADSKVQCTGYRTRELNSQVIGIPLVSTWLASLF